MRSGRILPLAISLCLLVSGMASAETFSRNALALWTAYVDEVTRVALQPDCAPIHIPAAKGRYRGVSVLYHGYTACPQQLRSWGNQLSEEGFEVLIPLQPGHGRAPVITGKELRDDTSDLPTLSSWRRYLQLVEAMNTIVRYASGTRLVGGLSLGGAMASAAAITGDYDASLILVPFYEVSKFSHRWSARTVGKIRGLSQSEISLGKLCLDNTKRNPPRRGYCHFKITHINAARYFGAYARKLVAEAKTIRGAAQFVALDQDPAVSTPLIGEVYREWAEKGKASACYFLEPVRHSILSKFDNPDQEMFWLPGVLDSALRFFLHSDFFPSLLSRQKYGMPPCELP